MPMDEKTREELLEVVDRAARGLINYPAVFNLDRIVTMLSQGLDPAGKMSLIQVQGNIEAGMGQVMLGIKQIRAFLGGSE